MSAYPGAVASFIGFTAGHSLLQDVHASQHNLEQSEIVAVQTKVGTGASTPTANKVLRATGTGVSIWAQVDMTSDITGVTPVANGGTGTTTLNFPSGSDTLVGRNTSDTLTNKTITTPTISDFSNADHNHANNPGGGQLNGAAAIVPATLPASVMKNGMVKNRQGGTVGDNSWATVGTSNTDTSAKDVFIQCGSVQVTSGDTTVTFPIPFTVPPVVIATTYVPTSFNTWPEITAINASNFHVRMQDDGGVTRSNEFINWIAVGQ